MAGGRVEERMFGVYDVQRGLVMPGHPRGKHERGP
jgi:hypothetical protein